MTSFDLVRPAAVLERIHPHLMRRLGRVAIVLGMVLAMVTSLLAAPPPARALDVAAQQPNPRTLALTAADLGDGWSVLRDRTYAPISGFELYEVRFIKDKDTPASRVAIFSTGYIANVAGTESLVRDMLGYLERNGETIRSVQDRGFGDGRAFQSNYARAGSYWVTYMFRVQTLFALVELVGPEASEGALKTQAEAFARKQEQKLWSIAQPGSVATPAPSAPPAPAPTAPPAPVATPVPAPAPAPAQAAAPYCQPGERPAFLFGFAALREQLGPRMGDPTSCNYGDPKGSGDTLQNTTAGLAFYRRSTNTPTFTNGFEHWALTASGMVYWTGDSIDPPPGS